MSEKTAFGYFEEFIVGLLAFVSFLIISLLITVSRHFSVAFNIPKVITGIYFSKLYSLRGLFTFTGSLITFIMTNYTPIDKKIINFISYCLTFVVRLVFCITLHISKDLRVKVYYILIVESFFYGLFQINYFGLIGRHASVATISLDLSAVFIFITQTIMDQFWFSRPLFMVKIQAWIILISTLISIPFWYYFLYHKPESHQEKENPTKKFECKNFKKFDYRYTADNLMERAPGFGFHLIQAFSPFMMLMTSYIIKDVLFPGVLPFSLLDRDKCHLIFLLVPPFYFFGSFMAFMFKEYVPGYLDVWPWQLHLLWLFIVPEIIVFILCMMTIHSKSIVSKYIVGSKPAVMAMTLVLLVCFSSMESHSYAGVAFNIKYEGQMLPPGIAVLEFHNLVAVLCRFIFSKISVGYNQCRMANEVVIESFHPTYKMNPVGTLYYWISTSLKNGVKDSLNDFKTSLEEYFNPKT